MASKSRERRNAETLIRSWKGHRMKEKPIVITLANGGKCWEHQYNHFYLKAYMPATEIDGRVNNYTFRAPLLTVFEENRQSMEEAVKWADESGFDKIAAATDSSVLFVFPTCEGGWKNADESLYAEFIAEVRMVPEYEDGLSKVMNFFTQEFEGYFIRGAKFRTDIYSFGASADYVATKLLKTLEGEDLWGPGEITPAVCSMERLGVMPCIERKDIPVISVANSTEINKAFENCDNVLIKDKADYTADFETFVKKYKMWCGNISLEPDMDELDMVEEAGCIKVKTSKDTRWFKGVAEHKTGYFAYYNKGLFDNGPVPLVLGLHGGGDSAFYFTFTSNWYDIAHRYGFLYVAVENHHMLTATEVNDVVSELKNRYDIDEKRIYATGFSMGSCKIWELVEEYPMTFAAIAPLSALPPVGNNPISQSYCDTINTDIPVPVFYSGGEESPLPELPNQVETSYERFVYAAKLNRQKSLPDMDFSKKENWKDKIWCAPADRTEKIKDESHGSILTVNYYDSEDGVCRSAWASVSGQQHECRPHSCENAWRFISQFTR